MRIHEITEARQGMLGYLQSLVPSWPGYVVKDWLYASFSKSGWAGMRQEVEELLLNQGLTTTTQWRFQTVSFTMAMWEPTTKTRLTSRAGGTPQPEFNVPRDAERHATQAGLAQQQGGVRDEPVIMVKTKQGWELIEGWHRSISDCDPALRDLSERLSRSGLDSAISALAVRRLTPSREPW